ncbi:hypothetical protein [Streptomyces lancefieldiae]|uniref:Secreted protein n=1 Tax=Streptomyces lancefieldiae TaxID=3075520 RepID=A0ABU3B035_9ACTN|nr:hypothetical protein [Streptomyces sp. DSM 40712]MDT0615805.1 hypothetical protein [Streptomyces sp. DSM 40712]
MHARQKMVRSVTSARRRLTTVAVALAGTCAFGLVTAVPASAEVSTKCGTYICVNTAHQGKDYVQDITVTTRDGLTGTLRGFVRDYAKSAAGVSKARFTVNREFSGEPLLVCGGLDRGGRVIENTCVALS